jgi:hypothetical protein
MATLVPDPLRLIGNAEENFYILGKKHQTHFARLTGHGQSSSTVTKLLRALRQAGDSKRREMMAPEGLVGGWCKAYCEGLEITYGDFLGLMDRLEGGSVPGAAGVLPASTSILRWSTDSQDITHTRIVDWYPGLTQSPVESLLLQSPGQMGLLLVGMPGVPFLPLTLMNEEGVTLALHAKHHPLNHEAGRPVGLIAIEAMLESTTTTELRRALKRHQTRHFWGFVSTDAGAAVLAMDIMGPQQDGQTFQGPDSPLLVFNSTPLLRDKQNALASEPPAHGEISKQRRQWCLERAKDSEASTLLTVGKLTRPPKGTIPAISAATVQLLSLNPSARRLEMLVGGPPLWAQETMASWENLFQSGMQNPTIKALRGDTQEWQAHHAFALAQAAMDSNDPAAAYHHLQMGLASAKEPLKSQGEWVWAWWQWQHQEAKRDRLHLPHMVQGLLAKAAAVHRPHLALLLFLLEWELQLVPTIAPPDLPSPFREWCDSFLVAPPLKRREMLQTLSARLDTQDLLPLRQWN